MNKYKQPEKGSSRSRPTLLSPSYIEHEGLTARMHKPGYRRKMRHEQNRHTKNISRLACS